MIPKEFHVYQTDLGQQVCGDSQELLALLPEDSVDLIITSPPFALLRKKSYGNEDQSQYVNWLAEFGKAAFPALKETGSLVLDLGGAYQKGRPVRSLYNYRVLIKFCDEIGYRLAEEFFWYNPAKLPSHIEWVNKKKIRAKELKKRTLTNLYNQRPTWLDLAYRRLDEAVFAAYGWDAGISDEELLGKLLELNPGYSASTESGCTNGLRTRTPFSGFGGR